MRAVWFVAGAGAGAYAVARARRVAEAFTPDGLTDRLAGLAAGARLFGAEVQSGMVERDAEIRARWGVRPTQRSAPRLSAGSTPAPATDTSDQPGAPAEITREARP